MPVDSRRTEERSSRAPTWSWGSVDCQVSWEEVRTVEATAEITAVDGGHPRVKLTCRTTPLKDVDVRRLTAGDEKFGLYCIWDHPPHDSKEPPDAVLIRLASNAPRQGKWKVRGIVGVPTGSADRFRRVGLFEMRSCSKDIDQNLWGKKGKVLLE